MRNLLFSLLIALLCSCQNKSKDVEPVAEAEDEMAQEQNDAFEWPSDLLPDEDVYTCISEDGNVKFYCWNTWLGGTCPSYAVLCQFRTRDGEVKLVDFSEREGEPAWVSKVYAIKKDDGSVYYIAKRRHKASSNDGYMWIEGFAIDGDSLKNVSVFDCSDDLDECGLDINYNIYEWATRIDDDGWDWLFEYDAETGNLYVPLTICEEIAPPIISDRYHLYHFDGMGFVDKGEVPHKGLHQSLSNYRCLLRYMKTKNFIARVDLMENDACRLALWRSSKDMSMEPDVVSYAGVYDEENNYYMFNVNGVECVVGYNESILDADGHMISHEYVLVKMNPLVVIEDESLGIV